MSEWQPESSAPQETAVLIYNWQTIAVGRLSVHSTGRRVWFLDESFGYNEDGEIYGVTHWMPLPAPPTEKP